MRRDRSTRVASAARNEGGMASHLDVAAQVEYESKIFEKPGNQGGSSLAYTLIAAVM
jgi:hypothetical protein